MNPNVKPVHAKARIIPRSNQMGALPLKRRWNKSVRMYGAFGKNNNQTANSDNSASLLFRSFEFIIISELTAHGIKARNKFQFRKRKKNVSEKKQRIRYRVKQNSDMPASSSV